MRFSSARAADWVASACFSLAIACAVGALFAVVYVVYAAPLLLAEIALDAAVDGAADGPIY